MIATLKIFGKGQITLPKEWRERVDTEHFIAEETSRGLLIKPLTEIAYYEIDEENFGLNFPMGIEASELYEKLKNAAKKVKKDGKVR